MTLSPDDVTAWLSQRREASTLSVRQIPFDSCDQWIVGDEIRHRSGRYFQVVGVRVDSGPMVGWSQPMLRQTEVGILGFLTRPTATGTEWLVQAKTEPGNVGGTQLAPTVQATRSNYMRVHGGAETRHLRWFVSPPAGVAAAGDVLASEQGTRFLHKFNRNVAVATAQDAGTVGPAWRWVPAPTIRALLARDYVLNTDARSVIVTAPWSLLADGCPAFAPRLDDDEFRCALVQSYAAPPDAGAVDDELARRRARGVPQITEVSLTDLPGWTLTDCALASPGSGTSLVCVEVSVADREVAAWCQPLLQTTVTTCELWCARDVTGDMRFAFRYSPEPGLSAGVELGPTTQSDIGGAVLHAEAGATVRLAVRQSDEGGRFMHSVCEYRIVEVPAVVETGDHAWLTLADIAVLAARPETFTNEARSALSLLLSLA